MVAWVPGIAFWDTLGPSYGPLGHVGLGHIWQERVKIRGTWSNTHGLYILGHFQNSFWANVGLFVTEVLLS